MTATLEARLLAKVSRDPSGCWTWTASRDRLGYGRIRVSGRTALAHRVAYELLVGPVADGLALDHLCRNRACVNPAHLEPVSHRENVIRGVSFAAANAAKDACPAGHALSGDNLYVYPDGRRQCRACQHDARRRHAETPRAQSVRAAYRATERARELARERNRRYSAKLRRGKLGEGALERLYGVGR